MNMSQFQCCFCNKGIKSNDNDPCELNVVINIDKALENQYNQFLFCHLLCLTESLPESV